MNTPIDNNQLEHLIQSYYDGTASAQQITSLLQAADAPTALPPTLLQELNIIKAIERSGCNRTKVPADLTCSIEQQINLLAAKERRKWWQQKYVRIAIAACMVISVTLSATFIIPKKSSPNYRTINNPEEAKQYIAKTNQILADCFRKAEASQQQAQTHIDNVFESISKYIK
ncbi:MAG: hypothetical protein K2M94_06320 [Paramuribaculum sp.]|nr:hypothetical protein [Paramuribaculum sp.]